jgi:hypothetical protein
MRTLQSLDRKKLLRIFSIALIALALPFVVFISQKQQEIRQRASEITNEPVRGQANDLWADIVLGQKDFSQINAGTVANKVWLAHGVIIDQSVTPNRMYIYDSGNNRILGFSSNAFQRCITSSTNPLNCTADLVYLDNQILRVLDVILIQLFKDILFELEQLPRRFADFKKHN